MPIPIAELQKTNPSAIIELFTLTMDSSIHGSVVDSVYRFHNGSNHSNAEVVWAANSYQRFPITAEGFAFEGRGQIPRPNLTMSNLDGSDFYNVKFQIKPFMLWIWFAALLTASGGLLRTFLKK